MALWVINVHVSMQKLEYKGWINTVSPVSCLKSLFLARKSKDGWEEEAEGRIWPEDSWGRQAYKLMLESKVSLRRSRWILEGWRRLRLSGVNRTLKAAVQHTCGQWSWQKHSTLMADYWCLRCLGLCHTHLCICAVLIHSRNTLGTGNTKAEGAMLLDLFILLVQMIWLL